MTVDVAPGHGLAVTAMMFDSSCSSSHGGWGDSDGCSGSDDSGGGDSGCSSGCGGCGGGGD
ncbi:hypothetical protein [Pseudochryseolinea flava]|uniref:Uncharacterized protein n=1 Tax=Pseudochryseolinea flava TaxID=2059302 RepID=A0A364XWI4_9BACT|nr:hypothetical protein [Pseudochryseolinea flava]RAV98318.1 hypothetical protein DQQ10_24535 [Pseudochryseolinea flava]